MLKSLCLATVLAAFLLPAGETTFEMPFSAELNRETRWRAAASGDIRLYSKDGVIRVECSFQPGGGDRWCYPQFVLKAGESFAGAAELSFEIRSVTAAAGGVKFALLQLEPIKSDLKLPLPTGEWQRVTLDLRPLAEKLTALRSIRLGMNPSADQLEYEVRNFKLTTLQAPPPEAVAALEPVPWGTSLMSPKRWRTAASGEIRMRFAPEQQALEFTAEFPGAGDRWLYPQFRLGPGESFADVVAVTFEIRGESADGIKLGQMQLEPIKQALALPPLTPQWQSVVLDCAKLPDRDQITAFRIGMNPRSTRAIMAIRNLKFWRVPFNPAAGEAAFVLEALAPAAVFTDTRPLRFRQRPLYAKAADYQIRNWRGKLVASGAWPKEGAGELVLPPLPRGSYALAAKPFTGTRGFLVVADPAGRVAASDGFFAIDSAQSWLCRANPANPRVAGDSFELASDLARLAGFSMVRDRMSWSETEPVRGKFDWKQYKTNARLLHERGIPVAGMFHNSPAWARTHSPKLPDDLFALYDYAERLAVDFKGEMGSWEFWNEPDNTGAAFTFSTEPVWDFAATMKAAYLGFKAGDPDTPVLNGAFCIHPLLDYDTVLFENGVADYMDIMNMHTYLALRQYPEIVGDLRKLMAKYGIGDLPIWFTESGTAAEGTGRLDSFLPGLKQLDPEQELIVAEFIPKSGMLLQQLGVARNFFFALAPVNEGGGRKAWGLLRHDFTAQPGLAAFAVLTRLVGNAKLLGTLELKEGCRGYLYEDAAGSQTLAFWSLSELDTEPLRPDLTTADVRATGLTLPVPDGDYTYTDLLGAESVLTARNGEIRLPADRYPAYLSGLKGLTPTVPAAVPAAHRRVSTAGERAIVLKTVLSEDFKVGSGKNNADLKSNSGRLTLQIFNLADTALSGQIALDGAAVSGLPEAVTVAAKSKMELPLVVTPQVDGYRGELRFRGTFGGKSISSLVIPLLFLSRAKNSELSRTVELGDPGRWRANSSGKTTLSFDEKENAFRVDVDFPEGVDRWCYPEFILNPEERLDGAYGVSFEIRAVQREFPDPGYAAAGMMAAFGTQQEHAPAVMLKTASPHDRWSEVLIPFENKLDPAKIKMLRIGVNPKSSGCTYWLRNFRVIRLDRN